MKKKYPNQIVNLRNNFFIFPSPLFFNLKRVLLLFIFFLFAANAYSQTAVIDVAHTDLRLCGYHCTTNYASVSNVYLSATPQNGSPLEDFVPTCVAGRDKYAAIIWMNYTQNQNNDVPESRLFATLNMAGVATEINKYSGNISTTRGLSPARIPITTEPKTWTCGQTLSFTYLLAVWNSKITIVNGTIPYNNDLIA